MTWIPLLETRTGRRLVMKEDFIFAIKDYCYSEDPVSFNLSDTDNKRYIYVYHRWKSL